MKCNQERNGGRVSVGVDPLLSRMDENENRTLSNDKNTVKKGTVSYDSYRTDSGYNSCSATSITSSSKCDDDEYDRTSNRIVSMNKLTDSGISVSSSSSTSSSGYSLQESSAETFSVPVRNEADSGLGLDERFSRLSVESSNISNCNDTICTLDNVLLDKLESYNVCNYVGSDPSYEHPVSSQLDVIIHRQKLIEEAFLPDKDGDNHLHLSIVHGRYDIINTLIQLAPDPSYLDLQNNLFQCPLHLAVLMGLSKVVRRLLLAGAALDVRNKVGNTPLHLACERGDVECVRELLRPASILEVDYLRVRRRGWSPTLPSSNYGTNGRSSANLISAATVPQDLELRNYEGQMCVHLAAVGQHVQVIGLLKQYGANMNSGEGKSGRTALWYAIEARNVELMSFLVRECDASINEPTYAGITPFQMAYAQGTNLANGLLNLGACPTVPVLSDSDSDYSSIDDDESMDTDMIDGSSANYFDLKINGEPLW